MPDLTDGTVKNYEHTDRNSPFPSMPNLEDTQDIMESRLDNILDPLVMD